VTATAAYQHESRLLVDGSWRHATAGRSFSVFNPATEQAVGEVADASAADALAACDAAARALGGWAATPPRERGELLRSIFERIIADSERLAELISLENGKALGDAVGEVRYAAEFFRWFSEEGVRNRGWTGEAPSGSNRMVVVHQPIGVCVLVTPWNFPAAMATRKIAPALAAGCTVVLKPASATPLTALALGRIVSDAGVPAGVVNVVTTSQSSEVVGVMLQHPAVRKLSFTGSTSVGKALLAKASERVISCSMELGGNAPFLVFNDADMDAAVDGAMVAKMRNGGEACTAANRFYVQRECVEEFARRLAERMAAVAIGPGQDPTTACGPLIDSAARAKVVDLVADAVSRGARVLAGGGQVPGPGYFVQPTVLVDVPVDARILHEEVFGPVAPIVPFSTTDEVISAANGTEYGLVAYVYTSDLAKGLWVAEKLEVGMVGLNRGLVSDPAAPFGGMKESGLGREGAHDGLMEFLETKYIAVDW
jgi:succinate-semialdehyde dehydrogenase/glutarate-semialdehyde dehydrogenase